MAIGVGCTEEGESISLAPEVAVESEEAADVAVKAAATITDPSDLAEVEVLSTASTLDLSSLSSSADGLGSSTATPAITSSSTSTTSSTTTTVPMTTTTSTTAAPTTTGSTVVTTATTAAPTTTATTAAPTSESTTTAAPTTASTSAPTTTAAPTTTSSTTLTTQPPAGGDFDQAEAASLALLNELRASLGLGSLTASDQEMSTFARSWSAEMSRSGFRHSSARWAENIVWHSSDRMTPQEAAAQFHDMWVNSPGHYRNMTNPNWTVAGVGLYRDSGGWWGTHVFR
ncbi:MAG: CAP domain-containing protein [Acidimicrobiales bacterium]